MSHGHSWQSDEAWSAAGNWETGSGAAFAIMCCGKKASWKSNPRGRQENGNDKGMALEKGHFCTQVSSQKPLANLGHQPFLFGYHRRHVKVTSSHGHV